MKKMHINKVIKKLFTNRYTEKTKKDVLSYCECNKLLYFYIKKYHEKYIDEKSVMVFTLAKDLGYI